MPDRNSRRRLASRLLAVLAGLCLVLVALPVMADPSTTIVLTIDDRSATVNDSTVSLDTAPVIDADSNRTFVPVRFIGETLGAYVGWDGDAKKVTYLTADTKIELWIGDSYARVNGSAVKLDAAPYIDDNGRTLVPVRFVSQQLGADISWNGSTKEVTISAAWIGKVVQMQNFHFSPANITIPVGARITWVNLDTFAHNVMVSGTLSPNVNAGTGYARTFTKAGTYHVECSFHPGMEGTITVE